MRRLFHRVVGPGLREWGYRVVITNRFPSGNLSHIVGRPMGRDAALAQFANTVIRVVRAARLRGGPLGRVRVLSLSECDRLGIR